MCAKSAKMQLQIIKNSKVFWALEFDFKSFDYLIVPNNLGYQYHKISAAGWL